MICSCPDCKSEPSLCPGRNPIDDNGHAVDVDSLLQKMRILEEEREESSDDIVELIMDREKAERATVAAIVAWLRGAADASRNMEHGGMHAPAPRAIDAAADAVERGDWRNP